MKELSQLQLLSLAKEALANKADTLVSRYLKPFGCGMSKREIITATSVCFEQIDWIDSEIERIRKENPTPPRLK